MKLPKTLHLVYLVLIISLTSCSEVDTLQEPINEDVKSSTEVVSDDLANEDYNMLTVDEIALLLDKDENNIGIEILELINTYRDSLGLKKLINNETAKIQALSHTEYQGNQQHISHENSSIRAATIFKLENATFYGENVAFGYSSVEKLVTAWINSESHRVNIEGDFTYSGIGTIANDKGVLYFTQIFFK